MKTHKQLNVLKSVTASMMKTLFTMTHSDELAPGPKITITKWFPINELLSSQNSPTRTQKLPWCGLRSCGVGAPCPTVILLTRDHIRDQIVISRSWANLCLVFKFGAAGSATIDLLTNPPSPLNVPPAKYTFNNILSARHANSGVCSEGGLIEW